jgi:general stress protein 13
MSYKIGDIVEGEITGIQTYGAFVSMDENTQGLIHVSEIQSGYTKNIHNYLEVGQKVRAEVIDIDDYSHKISLSLRTLDEHPEPRQYYRKKYFTNKNKKIGFDTIEHQLPIWTDEALHNLTNQHQ